MAVAKRNFQCLETIALKLTLQVKVLYFYQIFSTHFKCESCVLSGSDLAFLPGSEPFGPWRCVVASMKETSGVQEDLGRPQVRIPQQGSKQLPGQRLLTDYFCTDHLALITGLTAWTFLAGFLVGHK